MAIPGVTAELQSQDSLKIHIRGVENQRYMGEKPVRGRGNRWCAGI